MEHPDPTLVKKPRVPIELKSRQQPPQVTPGDKAEADSRRQAVLRIQSTVRWLLATVAAIASVVLAGVNLSDVRTAARPTQTIVLVFTFVCLAFVALTLWSASRALVAKPMAMSQLLSSNVRRTYERELKELETLTVGGVHLTRDTLETWRWGRRMAGDKLEFARYEWRVAGSSKAGPEYAQLRQLEDDVANYDAALAAAEAIAEYRTVKCLYDSVRRFLIGTAIAGASTLTVIILYTKTAAS